MRLVTTRSTMSDLMDADDVQKMAKNEAIAYPALEAGFVAGYWVVPVAPPDWRKDLQTVDGDQGPWLVLKEPLRKYSVLGRSLGLQRAFFDLSMSPTEQRLLAFVRAWGPLGLPEPLVPVGSPRGGASYVLGESLHRWRDVLSEFRMLTRVSQDLAVIASPDSFRNEVVRAARSRLRVRRLPDRVIFDLTPDHHGLAGARIVVWPGDAEAELRERLGRAPDTEAVRYFLAREINKHLVDVHPAVLPFMQSRTRLVPKTLLASIYLRMAQGLGPMSGTGLPQRPCDYCNLPFLPTRRDVRHCSTSCKNSARYRRRTSAHPSQSLK